MIREFIDAVKDIASVLKSIDRAVHKIANDGLINQYKPVCCDCSNKQPCSKCGEPLVRL